MGINGKTNAFTSLVEDFQAPVYTLCSLLLDDGPSAERAAQEAFIQAYEQFHGPNPPYNSQTWLLRIAYRQCLSWHTLSPGQKNRAGGEASQNSTGKDPAVLSLLAGLEPVDRALIALRYCYRLELPDIAWVMGTDGEKVENRLRQAQKTLAAQYCLDAPSQSLN